MTNNQPTPPLQILVTVGTHEQGFPRLLAAVQDLIQTDTSNIRWRVQSGTANVTYPENVVTRPAYSHHEMISNLEWSDAMISQASPGNVFTALAALSQPIVMARRFELAEHVDNHQTIFAQYVVKNRLAMVAEDVESITRHLDTLRAESPRHRRERLSELGRLSQVRTTAWVNKFDGAIRELASN
jgi:UDP-N-acetylglucosamine transferase subunit ALG13